MDVLHLDFRISENKLFLSLLLLLFLRLLATLILPRRLVQITHPRVYELHFLFLCYIPNNLLQQQMARRPSTRQCVDSGHKLRLFIVKCTFCIRERHQIRLKLRTNTRRRTTSEDTTRK